MYTLEIFADYHQFYLMDSGNEPDYPSDVTDLNCSNMAKVAAYIVAVYTARNATVPVTIFINAADPGVNLNEWDHVVECSLNIPSGRLVVIGCTDYLPDAQHLEIKPDIYQIRICYEQLDTVSADSRNGKDRYVIYLWPGEYQNLQIIKQWQNAPYL